MNGILISISGPSGGGKTSLLERLLYEHGSSWGLQRVVTSTTRPQASGEIEGHTYNFMTLEQFQTAAAQGLFLEISNDYGNWYGTPASLKDAVAAGKRLVVVVDRAGIQAIKAVMPTLSVWIAPSSPEVLEGRLKGRGRDEDRSIEERLAQSREDMKAEYEHPICANHCLNDDFEHAYRCLESLIEGALLGL